MVVMSSNNGNISILNQSAGGKDHQQQLQQLQIQQIQATVQQKQQFGQRPPFPQQLQFQTPNAANLIQTQQQQQQAVQNQLIQQQALAQLNSQHQQQQQQQQQQNQLAHHHQAAGHMGPQLIINGQANTVQTSQVLTLSSSGATTVGSTTIQPKSTMIITTASPHSGHQGSQGVVAGDRPIMAVSNAVQIVNSAGQSLSSPQGPLQPPPNPLLAMSSLAVHPLQSSMTKEMSMTPISTVGATPNKDSGASLATTMTATTTVANTTTTVSTADTTLVKVANEEKAKPVVSSVASKLAAATTTATVTPAATETSTPTTTVTGVTNGNISGNASMKVLEKGLPKAMVKPQVLTHVIEGFVIQESNEPFPVTRQRYTVTTENGGTDDDEPPKKKLAQEIGSIVNGNEADISMAAPEPDQLACEVCGKVELKAKMKKKRYCSITCSKSAKAQSKEGNGLAAKEELAKSTSMGEDFKMDTSCDNSANSMATTVQVVDEESCDIVKWTVTEVCDFIRNLPGCTDYVEDFETQEIDGQALLLLKENHLVNAMGMKLGPALKIVARVEALRAGSATVAAQAENEGIARPQLQIEG